VLPKFISTNNSIGLDAQTVMVNEKESPLVVKHLPGDLAMWFFILAELTVFAILFIGFAVSEQLNPEIFAQAKTQLHQISGLINTLALITSSYFVAIALTKMHHGLGKQAAKLLVVAKLVACIYIGVKVWEYFSLFDQGIGIETNTFFTLYFMITFFHLMHVLLGMVILVFVAIKAAKNEYNASNISGFESGASYWHMVPLIYVI